jgi:hypothetical protein
MLKVGLFLLTATTWGLIRPVFKEKKSQLCASACRGLFVQEAEHRTRNKPATSRQLCLAITARPVLAADDRDGVPISDLKGLGIAMIFYLWVVFVSDLNKYDMRWIFFHPMITRWVSDILLPL